MIDRTAFSVVFSELPGCDAKIDSYYIIKEERIAKRKRVEL